MTGPELPPPPATLATANGEPGWAAWLDGLAALGRDVLAEWDLTPAGPLAHGRCAVVLPVLTATGEPAALKLAWPHEEARHEHLALRDWAGDGAVRLLRADPGRWALLLERAHPRDLTTVDDVAACEVVGSLVTRLARPAPPQLARLSTRAADWSRRLTALPRSAPVPRRIVEHAAALARDLATDPRTDGTLLHSDLHFENVLAADREPWLAIDPKPLSGDPAYEVAPVLWNRWAEVTASGDVRGAIRRRWWAVVDAADLDPDRARDWAVVRLAVNALGTLEAAPPRGLTPADQEWLTTCVTVVKAVTD